jgi:hypothetical protein
VKDRASARYDNEMNCDELLIVILGSDILSFKIIMICSTRI